MSFRFQFRFVIIYLPIGRKALGGRYVIMKNTDKIYAEKLASEYAPKSAGKAVALRKLDEKVKRPPLIAAFTAGIAGTLVFGTGMCLVMKVIGSATTGSMIGGIALGVLGMIIVGVNYPIYKKFLAARKKKYAFEVLQLAKEVAENAEE